jgi:lipopolysaccharide export system protein LptC
MAEAINPTIARTKRQKWAAPRSRHDLYVKFSRVMLPAMIAILTATLLIAPLTMRGDVSFMLAKDTVSMAKERLRVTAATYRGQDGKGQPFEIKAGSAVQQTSRNPIVALSDLSANIRLPEGPATIAAKAGRYDMDREVVHVDGPVVFTTADGYRLATRDVVVGLDSRKMASGGAVEGQMPLGSFSAGQMTADLATRTVILEGRAHLHIIQGRAR